MIIKQNLTFQINRNNHTKEDYAKVKYLLEKNKYSEHAWDLCGDFKMLGFLLGLQGGYTKHLYFLCLWDCLLYTSDAADE